VTDVPPATALPHSLSGYLQVSPRKATQLQAHHTWQIEENFQAGKGLTGLEEHRVRSVTAIRRHQTLVNCASERGGPPAAAAASPEAIVVDGPPTTIGCGQRPIDHIGMAAASCSRNAQNGTERSWRAGCHRRNGITSAIEDL
jgi:hypothetical protein